MKIMEERKKEENKIRIQETENIQEREKSKERKNIVKCCWRSFVSSQICIKDVRYKALF